MNGHVKLVLVIAISIAISYLVLQAKPANTPIDAVTSCQQDSDCVPAECCHPNTAVNKRFAPDCAGTFCSAYCAPNTLDCGNGEIKCVNKVCKVVLK